MCKRKSYDAASQQETTFSTAIAMFATTVTVLSQAFPQPCSILHLRRQSSQLQPSEENMELVIRKAVGIAAALGVSSLMFAAALV